MSDEARNVIIGGSQSWTGSALAHDFHHVWRFSIPLAKIRAMTEAMWAIEDDRRFQFEVGHTMRTKAPSGYCATCGVGFVEFIACEGACDWRDDPTRSPYFQFAGAHPQLDAVGRWQTAPEPARTAPVDGWQTE